MLHYMWYCCDISNVEYVQKKSASLQSYVECKIVEIFIGNLLTNNVRYKY